MKVTVIGAGVVGIMSAYYLRQHGMEVTVLESASGPAVGGATYASGGYNQASAPDPWNAPGAIKMFQQAWLNTLTGKADSSAFAARTLTLPGMTSWGLRFLSYANLETFLSHMSKNRDLAQYSLKAVNELNEKESLEYDRLRTGSLIIYRDEAALQSYIDIAKYVEERGSRFEVLDRDALLAKEPSLSDIREELQGAVHYPDDQAGNSRVFCEQLAALCQNQGVDFQYETGATRINRTSDGIRIDTAQGTFDADAIVMSAGVHSKKLLKPLGIRLPIVPAKGFAISVPMHHWQNRPSHVIADMGPHAGVNPMGDILRVAGVAEFCGMKEGISEKRTDYLMGLLRQMFPSFAETVDPAECDPWGGHRPLSVDGLPMVGATEVDGVFLNTGHGGLGWTQAPGSARALADMIAGEKPEMDMSDFSLKRFN